MKRIAIFFLLISCCDLYATHNMGGTIVYQHITGLTYEATIITYTKASSVPADRDTLWLEWGDGTQTRIPRESEEFIEYDIKRNTYRAIHTYPSPGHYVLSMEDPNRNANILNIPASANVPFHLASALYIPTFGAFNNSVALGAAPILFAEFGKPFRQNIAAFDQDGDLLAFELVAVKGENGQDIAGYSIPNGVTLDPINGELTWDNPSSIGSYTLAIRITECRNEEQVGSVIVDFQLNITQTATIGQFSGLTAWPQDSNNRYADTVWLNDSIQLDLTYQASTDSVALNAYGELFTGGNNGHFETDSSSLTYLKKTFRWTPQPGHLRCTPYLITFRGSVYTFNTVIHEDISLMIFVRDSTAMPCDENCDPPVISSAIHPSPEQAHLCISPNPFHAYTTITIPKAFLQGRFAVSLFNIKGERVRYLSGLNNSSISIPKNDLPAGIYWISLHHPSGLRTTDKLIITD